VGRRPGKLSERQTSDMVIELEKELAIEKFTQAALIIKVRWASVIGILAILSITFLSSGQFLSGLGSLAVFVSVYNGLAAWRLRRYNQDKVRPTVGELRFFQNIQFALDISSLSMTLFILGGVQSLPAAAVPGGHLGSCLDITAPGGLRAGRNRYRFIGDFALVVER
jgi:hypothetical protein